MSNDPLKAIIDSLSAIQGKDTLELSPEEAAVAAKLLSKMMKPQDPVRKALPTISASMINLLFDAVITRDENDGTLDLIKNSCVSMFSAWVEEEGEESVGNLLGAYYLEFEEYFKGNNPNSIQKGKEAVAWLLDELDLSKYTVNNPLITGCGDPNCANCGSNSSEELGADESTDEDLSPF